MKNLLLALFLTTFPLCFGQIKLYSDQAALFNSDWESVETYDVETKITITGKTITLITEELNFFEEYTIISLTPPKVEGNPSIIEAIDDKENEAILLLDNKAILIIYNFKKENQFGFIYDLRK